MVEVKKQMLAYVLPNPGYSFHDTLPQHLQPVLHGQSSKHELQPLSVGPNHATRSLKLTRFSADAQNAADMVTLLTKYYDA